MERDRLRGAPEYNLVAFSARAARVAEVKSLAL